MSYGEELILSASMTAGTVFFHAVVIAAIAALFRATATSVWGPMRFVRDAVILTVLSLVLMAAHLIEIAAWAALFIRLGAFATYEASLYFSTSAYTTLGFGDVLLPEEWRLLGGAIAANGFLLFGLSAAFLFEIAARLRLGGERGR